MVRKLVYIAIVLFSFNIFAGFSLDRIPKWFMGYFDYQKEKYESAAQNYADAIDGEDDSLMHYNKGTADYKAGDYEAAEEAFTKAVEADPEFEPGWYNQGNARFRNDDLEGAVESYEKALELDPEDEDAQYNLDFVKKLLEKQSGGSTEGDEKRDQQDQSQKPSDEDSSEQKDSESQQDSKGNFQDNNDADETGEGEKGEPQDDEEQEKTGGGGGSPQETEEQPPDQLKTNDNTSGLTDEQIKNLLDALEQQEKALAGRMNNRPYGQDDQLSDPLGLFEELWSIQDDLDPFARIKRKQRDRDEIDW